VRAAYTAAAESARKARRGIYMGLDERLRYACRRRDISAVRYLLDRGAEPNAAYDWHRALSSHEPPRLCLWLWRGGSFVFCEVLSKLF